MLAAAPTVRYAPALLEAIARDEAAERRRARLTEPSQATGPRFPGRLGNADLHRLLAEDGAIVHPVPFSANRVGVSLGDLEDSLVDNFLATPLSADLKRPAAATIEAQAQPAQGRAASHPRR